MNVFIWSPTTLKLHLCLLICKCILFSFTVAQCPILHLENGSVTHNMTQIGAISRFKCDSGFTIVGFDMVQCLRTGIWTSKKPKCQSKIKQRTLSCVLL